MNDSSGGFRTDQIGEYYYACSYIYYVCSSLWQSGLVWGLVMKRLFGGLSLASMAFVAALPAVTQAQEPPTFQQIVQPYVDQGRFAGANGVVVTADGIINFPSAGYADVASKVPMTRDTLFWLASTSKPFQAVAVMMLVDDGKIGLDDPVAKYLPHFKPRIATASDGKETLREPRHPITVRMCSTTHMA